MQDEDFNEIALEAGDLELFEEAIFEAQQRVNNPIVTFGKIFQEEVSKEEGLRLIGEA